MFKRNPSLTEQVKSYLKQRIINAEFETGRIPSEATLATELSVSRNTIRDALSRLEMEGVIFRKQGAGTFINEANLLVKTRLEEIVPYENLIRDHGYTPSIRLLGVVQESAGYHSLRTELELNSDTPLLIIDKLFLADDQPVIFTRTYLPANLIKQPYTGDDFGPPIYEFLPKFCQQELAYYLSEIVPLIATPELADKLNLPAEITALLSLEELGHNQENQPIIKAVSYFRSDLLRLRLIRRQ